MNLETNFERPQAQSVGEAAELRTNERSKRATVLRSPSGQTCGEGPGGIRRIAQMQTLAHFLEALRPVWLPGRDEALLGRGRARPRVRVVFLQSRMAGKEPLLPRGQSRDNQRHRLH